MMSFLGNFNDYWNTSKPSLGRLNDHEKKSLKNENIILPPILVMTKCGWVYLLSNIGIKCGDNTNCSGRNVVGIELWHKTNRILYYIQSQQERLIVGEHPYLYSTPNTTTPSFKMIGDLYCFADVPQTYQQVSAIKEQQPIMNNIKNDCTLTLVVNETKGSTDKHNNSTENCDDQIKNAISSSDHFDGDRTGNDPKGQSLVIEEVRSNAILINRGHENKYKISLPDDVINNKNGHCIRTIAVHPQEEWIIAGAGSKLYLIRQGKE